MRTGEVEASILVKTSDLRGKYSVRFKDVREIKILIVFFISSFYLTSAILWSNVMRRKVGGVIVKMLLEGLVIMGFESS